jgi:hypothetical protein
MRRRECVVPSGLFEAYGFKVSHFPPVTKKEQNANKMRGQQG